MFECAILRVLPKSTARSYIFLNWKTLYLATTLAPLCNGIVWKLGWSPEQSPGPSAHTSISTRASGRTNVDRSFGRFRCLCTGLVMWLWAGQGGVWCEGVLYSGAKRDLNVRIFCAAIRAFHSWVLCLYRQVGAALLLLEHIYIHVLHVAIYSCFQPCLYVCICASIVRMCCRYLHVYGSRV